MTEAADQPSLALDTGPAIYLDALGYVEATSHVGDLVLPPAVVRELERKPNAWGARVPQLECTKLAVPDPGLVQIIAGQRALDAGEAEVIALAAGSGGVLPVLDDRKAREYAEANGIVIRGTVGILVELHERGLAARSIEQDISSLRGKACGSETPSLPAWSSACAGPSATSSWPTLACARTARPGFAGLPIATPRVGADAASAADGRCPRSGVFDVASRDLGFGSGRASQAARGIWRGR